MPLLFSLIAALEFVAPKVAQIQEPTFDVQLAIPSESSKKVVESAPVQWENGSSVGLAGSTTLAQLPPATARYQTAAVAPLTYLQASSGQTSAADVQVLIQRANTIVAQSRGLAQNTEIKPFTLDSSRKQGQAPFYYRISPTPPPAKLPNGRGWTWELKQIQDFDRVSTEFRNHLKQMPGFRSFNANEFKYYATPLFPEKQAYTFQSMRVNPTFQWNAPKVLYRVDAKAGSLFDTLTPRQKQLQNSSGFLHFNELSSAQQRLLVHPQGQFEIDYQSSDKAVKIKN